MSIHFTEIKDKKLLTSMETNTNTIRENKVRGRDRDGTG